VGTVGRPADANYNDEIDMAGKQIIYLPNKRTCGRDCYTGARASQLLATALLSTDEGLRY